MLRIPLFTLPLLPEVWIRLYLPLWRFSLRQQPFPGDMEW